MSRHPKVKESNRRSSQYGGRGLRFIARASSTLSCWRRTRRCSRRSRSSLTQRQRPATRLRLIAVGPHDAQNAVWCPGSTSDRRCAAGMPRVWVRPLRPSTSADGRLADLMPPTGSTSRYATASLGSTRACGPPPPSSDAGGQPSQGAPDAVVDAEARRENGPDGPD